MSLLVHSATMAVDVGKKRKPDGAAAAGRTKRTKKVTIQDGLPATSAPAMPDVIRVAGVVTPQFSAPVVATTPGLCVPGSIQFDSFSRPLRKSSKRTQSSAAAAAPAELLLHAASHRTVDFVGKEDPAAVAAAAAAAAPLRHYVGIYDPATGQLQVVEAKKMEIRGTVRSRDATEEQMTGTPLAPLRKTNMDLRNDLGQTFGTKKAKKAIQALTENAIGQRNRKADGTYETVALGAGDQVLMETMAAATASMATREELQKAVDEAKPVPAGNLAAASVEDVYVPRKILGADVLASVPVREWQQAVSKGEAVQVYSRFVAERVEAVAARDQDVGDAESLDRLRLLRYLYWMILYWQSAQPGKERGTKRQPPREKLREKMDGAPEAVLNDLHRRFSDNGTVRKFHGDLLMTHCCAFACVLDNFEVNIASLREDLKLEPRQMLQYFAEIGARIKRSKVDGNAQHVAKLELPLQFPQSMRQRKRR